MESRDDAPHLVIVRNHSTNTLKKTFTNGFCQVTYSELLYQHPYAYWGAIGSGWNLFINNRFDDNGVSVFCPQCHIHNGTSTQQIEFQIWVTIAKKQLIS